MAQLTNYDVAVLLMMFHERIIGKRGYSSLQNVRSKIKWHKIAALYGIKVSFDSVARRLVNKQLLSDDGKSLAVLYLDKLGVDYAKGYLDENPDAIKYLEEKMSEKS